MLKGMFTQGVCVLLKQPVSLDALENCLRNFNIVKRSDASEHWAYGGPSLVLTYLPNVNGLVSIDMVDKQWPDSMGDPAHEMMIFGAWSMGFFGPFAFPGGLQRASQQCWSWQEGRTIADQHRAFIRVRSSYAYGAEGDSPVIPKDYEPLPELEFVTSIVSSLLELPSALCYFNPNGELLRERDALRETLNFGCANGFPPLDAWSNVRMFNINEEWTLMDTVGNGQLDIPDVEACFHSAAFDFTQVDNFLRNVSLYVLNHGEVIKDGDTMDGPGGIRWQSRQFENGMCVPPRRVLRWLPFDGREVPQEIVNAGDTQNS